MNTVQTVLFILVLVAVVFGSLVDSITCARIKKYNAKVVESNTKNMKSNREISKLIQEMLENYK